MAHDAFISYATQDKVTADAVCATLEQRSIRCWIAPRDVVPGREWAESITDAMNEARVVILVFSASANASPSISREVTLAANRSIPIIPFRIEDVRPSKSLEFFISSAHWLDALTPEMEKGLLQLAETVKLLLGEPSRPGRSAEPAEDQDLQEGQYRAAVEIAWADGRLDDGERQRLDKLAGRLGLSAAQKATIEQEVFGDSRENILKRQKEEESARKRRAQDDSAARSTAFAFCRKCGAKSIPGAKFCKKCGASLTA